MSFGEVVAVILIILGTIVYFFIASIIKEKEMEEEHKKHRDEDNEDYNDYNIYDGRWHW